MDQEYIEYRSATFKGKLRIAKRFSRFYFNQFKPISKLEDVDLQRSRQLYRGFTFFTSVTCGYLSYRYRRMKLSMISPDAAPRDQNFYMNVFNDAVAAFLGYTAGNLLACDYIYKHRQYIIERLYFERQNNFDRNKFEGGLQEEYPFAEYVTITDKHIVDDRIHPDEVRQHSDDMRKKVEAVNNEYYEKQQQKELQQQQQRRSQ